MFLDASVPNPASVVIASVSRLEQLTIKGRFEWLNVEKGHGLCANLIMGVLLMRGRSPAMRNQKRDGFTRAIPSFSP